MTVMEVHPGQEQPAFDGLKREDEFGEWWSARDLMPLYGYATWQFFKPCIDRAKLACASSAQDVTSNFMLTHKLNASRHKLEDYRLTRYAAYLTAMAGDDAKPEIAVAKTYFAVQTRKAELGIDGFDDALRPIYESLLQIQHVRNEQKRMDVKLEAHEQQIAESASAIEAMRAQAAAAFAEIEVHRREFVALAERVGDVERTTPLTDTAKTYTGREAAQLCGTGLIRFYAQLRELKVLFKDEQTGGHKFYQGYMDRGWGEAKYQRKLHGSPGFTWVPCFTAKGIAGIQRLLEAMPQ